MKILSGLVLSVLILFSSPTLYAQIEFEAGFIVTLDGDTIQGAIEKAQFYKSPESIRFKPGNSGTAQEYAPKEVKEVYSEALGIWYQGWRVLVDVDLPSTNTGMVFDNKVANFEEKDLFLEVLSVGSAQLMKYVDDYGRKHFFVYNPAKGPRPVELEYRKFKEYKTNGGTLFRDFNKYRTQLYVYLGECKTMPEQVQKVDYTETALREIFTYYYDCISDAGKVLEKRSKIAHRLGLTASGDFNYINFEFDNYPTLVDQVEFGWSPGFSIGVYYQVLWQSENRNMAWNNELVYTSLNADGSFTNEGGWVEDYTFDFKFIQWSTGVTAVLARQNLISPIIEIGLASRFALQRDNEYTRSNPTFSIDPITREVFPENFLRGSIASLFIGAGVDFNRLQLCVRYSVGNGIDRAALKSRNQHLQLIARVRVF